MYKDLPRKYSSPVDKDDSPELDETELMTIDGIKQYQSLMGALQWAVTLGRFDIAIGVMTMARFRAAPRDGHMNRLKRILGYLRANSDGGIRFRTGIPEHEEFFYMPEFDWMYSVYGDVYEEIPPETITPKGIPMRITSFVDANLMHCKVTGRSATGILTFVDKTPVEWFSKKQATVETATYGSEFVAARIATEQIMDLRMTLRDMGIPLDGPAWLLGDNKSVITSSTLPSSTLSKRHNALAYHRVRTAVATKVLKFCHINGKDNIADIMTKFLPFATFWPFVEPVLFWKGETEKDTP